MIRAPFNRLIGSEDELDYTLTALGIPKVSGDGNFTADCHRLIDI